MINEELAYDISTDSHIDKKCLKKVHLKNDLLVRLGDNLFIEIPKGTKIERFREYDNWIPVEEKTPPVDEYVLVYVKQVGCKLSFISDKGIWGGSWNPIKFPVLAWQYLPSAYEPKDA